MLHNTTVFRKQIATYAALPIIGFAMYFPALIGSSFLQFLTPRITSQNQLETILSREKQVLDCDRNIVVHLIEEKEALASKWDDIYQIKLGGIFTHVGNLRHEIYHICDGHTEHEPTFWYYYFWAEPQAVLYGVAGLRISK